MEFKLINENKLKIALTNEDMESMDITLEEMEWTNTTTRRVFWDILDKAKRQTGFDAITEKTMISVQDRKSDGCVIFVTKAAPAPKNDIYNTYEKKYKKLYTGIKKKRLLYIFDNSETLFEVCRQLEVIGYNGKSDIFADDEKYYLYIEDSRDQVLDLISEYGFFINNPFFSFYLEEHTKKVLSSDAVKTFAEIFK